MNLTTDQAAGTVHSKVVEYSLVSKNSNNSTDNNKDDLINKITLRQKFSGDLLGGCTWRGAALLARFLMFEPAMEYLELKHYMRQKRYSVPPPATTTNNKSNDGSSTIKDEVFPFSSCIEIGSGAGLVSIAAAASLKFSSKIVATEDDDQEILSLLEQNLRENVSLSGVISSSFSSSSSSSTSQTTTVVEKLWHQRSLFSSSRSTTSIIKKLPFQTVVAPLRWGKMQHSAEKSSVIFKNLPPNQHYDIVLCAEVLYDAELVEPLLATLLALCGNTPNPRTGLYPTIILTNDTRAGDAASTFLMKSSKYFTIERFGIADPTSVNDSEMQREIFQEFAPDWWPLKSNEEGIFILQRKAEVIDLRTQLAKFERLK